MTTENEFIALILSRTLKNEELVNVAISIFEFTQYLLDEDENLTKTGNLTTKAKNSLASRIEELILNNDDSNFKIGEENDD